jgi:hypothetical protein
VKPAANLIMETALCHRFKRLFYRKSGRFVPGKEISVKKKFRRPAHRELRRRAIAYAYALSGGDDDFLAEDPQCFIA